MAFAMGENSTSSQKNVNFFDYIGGQARAKFYRIDGNEIMPY